MSHPAPHFVRTRVAATALVCAVGFISAAALSALPRPAAAATRGQPTTIALGALGRQIPASFLGLSIETSDLSRFEQQPGFAGFLGQLSTSGAGPLSLRIGGESADSSYLPPAPAPPGSVILTPAWFAALHTLVSSIPLAVTFNLNLAARSPAVAADEARATVRALPASALQAFELGNEPDLYRGGLVGFRRVADNPAGLGWAATYTPADYAADFRRFAHVLSPVIGRVPLAGPAIAWPDIRWWTDLPMHGFDRPGLITQHRYPYSACLPAESPAYPTIAGFLSSVTTRQLVDSVRAAVTIAHADGVPFRISEMNSASCGGLPGVTNTLAIALWAPDMLFRMLAAGVDGVDLHTRWDSWNTPLDGVPALAARPLFYGLALFARTLGAGARLQRVAFSGTRPAMFSAWAVHLSDGSERLLLVNRGSGTTAVRALLGTNAAVAALTLMGRGPASTTVTLGAHQLTSTGRFDGTPRTRLILPRQGITTVAVPAYSATLLSAPGRARAAASPGRRPRGAVPPERGSAHR